MTSTAIKRAVYESRSLVLNGMNTTVALERPYWRMLEVIAELTNSEWRDVVIKLLSQKPNHSISRAAYLRIVAVKLLIKCMNKDVHDRVFKQS